MLLSPEHKDDSSVEPSLAETNGDGPEEASSPSSTFYDKNRSFFDSISCEALDKNGSVVHLTLEHFHRYSYYYGNKLINLMKDHHFCLNVILFSFSCLSLFCGRNRPNWREERKLNIETFGPRSANNFGYWYRGGRGRGYGRGMNNYGMDNGYHPRGGYNYRG